MTLEEAQEKILSLEEEKKTLLATNGKLTEDVKTKDKRIVDLQEHNQKLFLKLTTEEKKEDHAEETLTYDKLIETLRGGK